MLTPVLHSITRTRTRPSTTTTTTTTTNNNKQLQTKTNNNPQPHHQIKDFMGGNAATPDDIRQMVAKTLNITINQNPAEIDELARQIKDTIQSLTEIDTILAQTKGDLAMAESLKRR